VLRFNQRDEVAPTRRANREADMAGYIRLQEPITLSSSDGSVHLQERIYAADITPYTTVTIRITILSAANAGTVQILSAMVNEEGGYVVSNVTRLASAVSSEPLVLQVPEGFIRWKVTGLTGSVTFMIDVLGRE
jgi:hypothetical protein